MFSRVVEGADPYRGIEKPYISSPPRGCANITREEQAPPLRCETICGAPSLARVILSERSESNCEAVGGEAEQDLTCHAGSCRLEKGYFIKEREGKPLPYGVKQYAVRRYNVCSYRLFDNGRIISSPTRNTRNFKVLRRSSSYIL